MLFERILKFIVRDGCLALIRLDGQRVVIGEGHPSCTLRLRQAISGWQMMLDPSIATAEAYMDGRLTIEEGTLREFVTIVARNYQHLEKHPLVVFGRCLRREGRRLKQYNPIGQARQNVAHHYDLSSRLYDLFLDECRQYSCAYFNSAHDDLETAQQNKLRHIAAKLKLDEPNLRLLDIGSGWGGLGLYLAQETDCDVQGVTLSTEQHEYSERWAQDVGLADRCRFMLRDYREQKGQFDRIVSVGMFEHVGKKNYDEFFSKVYELLDEDGVALMHTIGRFDEPAPINGFIRKYIFPGADLPSLSEIMTSVEKSGLFVTDIEVLRLHYAETLKAWEERFQENRDEVRKLYDERFCRMWELYLITCEAGFRYQGLNVFQVQLTKRLDALPITRDYMIDWERNQRRRDARAA